MNTNYGGQMIAKIKSVLSKQARKLPAVDQYLLNRRFRIERDLLNGRLHDTADHASILHFSVNKAATQYTRTIMMRCAQENGLIPVSMSAYAWNYDFPYLFEQTAEENQAYVHIFHPKGYLYTVFGGFVDGIPHLDRYLKVIMVRDPRDVVVSEYFSYAFSHPISPVPQKAEEIKKLRKRLQNMTLDQYAKESTLILKERFQKYVVLCQQDPMVCVLKYEDMIADFPSWLENLTTHCQLTISPSLKASLIESSNNAKKTKENIRSHRRQVTPGDHRRKLKPDTIAELNDILAEVMDYFGYRQEA